MIVLALLIGGFAAGLGWTWPLTAVHWLKSKIFPKPKGIINLVDPTAEIALWQAIMGGLTLMATIIGYIFVDTAIMNRLLLGYFLISLLSAALIWIFVINKKP